MPISPARTTAYRILRHVEAGRGFAVDQLQTEEVSALKEADRRLALELVMGILRWRGELDFQIERLSGKKLERFDPEVVTILRLGVYQILFLERVPKAVAVNEAVELTKAARKRSATGLVNAVLRKCQPLKERISGQSFEELSAESKERLRRAFPGWLWERWERTTATPDDPSGRESTLKLAHSSLQIPPTCLRVVERSGEREEMRRELASEGIATSDCLYAKRGLIVVSGHVQDSRAYRQGRVVIQDEGSQLVAEIVAPRSGQCVLDVCAAPGVKAGQIAQELSSGTLVACDLSASRLGTLSRLLPRWVPPGVRVLILRLDAGRELPFGVKFDRILLDAPCSGTGTLARNPEIKWRLKPDDLPRLANIQASMLRSALGALAPDGRLVYSTCSLEPEENEEVLEKVLSEEPRFRTLTSREFTRDYPALTTFVNPDGRFRTRPDEHPMDGFNAAVVVRKT